jgi:hypothetical protein
MALSHETKLHFTTSLICMFHLVKRSVHANMEVWPTPKLLGAVKLTGFRLRIDYLYQTLNPFCLQNLATALVIILCLLVVVVSLLVS